jgi:hypothetical protein
MYTSLGFKAGAPIAGGEGGMSPLIPVDKKQSSPVIGLELPGGFQEVKVPTFLDKGTGWW